MGDKFLDAMSGSVDKWLKAEPVLNVFGNEVKTNPQYISISYREKDDAYWTFLNGVEDEHDSTSNDAGYFVRVSVGDKEQGCGEAWSARDGIPRNPTLLSKLMDRNLDLATKTAVSSYLRFVSAGVLLKKDSFSRSSKEEVKSFFCRGLDNFSVNEDVREMLRRFTGDIYESGAAGEAGAAISTSLFSKRFVDSEGRKIREVGRLGKIVLEGSFNNNDGQFLGHGEVMTFMDGIDTDVLNEKMNDFYVGIAELKGAVTPVSDQYPVWFSGSALGTMIHEALGGHLLSGKYIKNGASTAFKGRIGSRVLPEFMTLIDDPRMKGASGFYLFDDEGIASKRTVLIKNGVLKNYLLDRGSARYLGVNSNGHSRMEWVTSPNGVVSPEPRVSNLEVISQDSVSEDALEEIVKKHCRDNEKECALYIESGDGEVDVSTSEFRMYPSKAYKIFPDGKREAVNNFVIVANAYELLNQIEVTGDEYEIGHGTCGSTSGGIPTQNIAPSAFIPKVNIQAIDSVKFKKELL